MRARDDELIDRIELTAEQIGLVGFTFNREGYSAVKHVVDGLSMTCFGVRFWIVDNQKERARAFWEWKALDENLQRNGIFTTRPTQKAGRIRSPQAIAS
jgi:hypothetical protein